MKIRYTPIITFAFAVLLVSSIAYAADRRKQAKLAIHEPEAATEEEALKAELLAATEERQEKAPGSEAVSSRTIRNDRADTPKERVKTTEK